MDGAPVFRDCRLEDCCHKHNPEDDEGYSAAGSKEAVQGTEERDK